MISADECVVLDGGVATELQRPGAGGSPDLELWGTWALYRAPQAVLDVHRRYAEAGCHVLSTNTWAILSAPELGLRSGPGTPETEHWMDVARLGIGLARRGVEEAGRAGECAVAFAISEEVNTDERRGTIELLSRVFEEEPPDLILLETLTLDPRAVDLRDHRAPARDRTSRLALVPALPARRLRRLRPALGTARGRPLRAVRAPLRGDGRRRDPHQLPARRPRPRDDRVAARLHRHAARRLPEPRPPRRRAVALRRRDRPGRVRGARARLARRGRADRRRLLRREPGAHRGRRPRARGHEAPGRRRPALDERLLRDEAEVAPTRALARHARDASSIRSRSPSSRSTRACSCRRPAATSLEDALRHRSGGGADLPRRRLRLRDPRRPARR